MAARNKATSQARIGQRPRFQRGMKRPDGRPWGGPAHSPLLSVTNSRKPYAVIPRSVLADQLLGDGPLVLLAILASLHRDKTALTLSAAELAASQGVAMSTYYERRHRLIVLGYLDESGALKPEYHPRAAAKAEGGFCRVDLKAVHGLPPQAVRALAALVDRCDKRKRSRARVATLARASGRSVRAWYRAFAALARAGWAWSRGRWRGLGRLPGGPLGRDSGKRHTPFRRMSALLRSTRDVQKESGPARPDGRFTPASTAQPRRPRRPTSEELRALPLAERIAALKAYGAAS